MKVYIIAPSYRQAANWFKEQYPELNLDESMVYFLGKGVNYRLIKFQEDDVLVMYNPDLIPTDRLVDFEICVRAARIRSEYSPPMLDVYSN